VVARDGEFAVATLCSCSAHCPQCRDSGWVALSDERRARRSRCAHVALTRRIEAFNQGAIPARHALSTRAGFDPKGERMPGFMAVNKYLETFKPGEENRGMVLYGAVGRGKTHLMVALLRDLVFRHGVTVRFVEFSHLVGDIKAGFDIGRGSHSVLDPLVKVDVLAIDELGKGRNTEFEGTVVDELVSRRYNAAAVILSTTNYAPGARTGVAAGNLVLGKTNQPNLADRVGDRVYSRLRETSDFVRCAGGDFREERRGRAS
jgi:DNA replication protein DnaC